MHLILTHENADFDAIASLLGAALLYPDALAVTPPTTNQNVRDFLTLYWSELPFTEHRDRPKGRIDQITMVDSQYVPKVRGQTKQTKIRIIDHHALSDHLPPDAEVILNETGANVTYLIEEIARANTRISPTQATLMLLGIYEDSGSLTYGNTTPRDVRAAAWLMEHGARLDVLRDFLHYPLSPAQQNLYNAVVNRIESHIIHGNQIMISAARATERVSEISSIAHRLRELYNPDGLFLLVAMEDDHSPHLQLIARSNTDTIHVGQIAEKFGGGGHPRAAAAHIARISLEEAYQQLLATLAEVVQPATTVRQIMSFTVRTLFPTQTIKQAAEMVTRYGHEGYPVVENNKIVGILTRREIDKAMHHHLGNAAVGQFMQKGEFYVSPHDTIETLQKVMLEAQAGQVPVLENGQIVGIVTRTDLMNLWSRHVRPPVQTMNLADQLTQKLPPPWLALLQEAGREAAQIGSTLYVVGGFVRDLLLGKPVLDFDLVVEGDAIALARAMQASYGGRVHSHKRFGAANWITGGAISGVERLDFVTARTEFYQHPTALPEVEQSSIKQDLHRRDFTINTLAICLAPDRFGDLLDFYGGYADLQAGHIRVLHSLSFVEDPTRILRAIRLEQRLGFQLGQRTLEHLANALDLMARVTPSRIFTELNYICQEQAPEKAFLRLSELGVLRAIHPRLAASNSFAAQCQRLRHGLGKTPWSAIKPGPVHYLGLLTFQLSAADTDEFIQRLHPPSELAKPLTQAQAIKQILPQLGQTGRNSQIYALLNRYSEDALLLCWLAVDDPDLQARLHLFSRELRDLKPVIDGHYLIAQFKLRPSPLFQKILNRLRQARLDGEATSLADEHQLVEAFLADSGSKTAPPNPPQGGASVDFGLKTG